MSTSTINKRRSNSLSNKISKYSTHKNTSIDVRSVSHQRIKNSEIGFLEDRIIALTGGVSSIALKSVKSAAFLLAKNLLRAGDNIVTFNSSNLLKHEAIVSRLDVEVRLIDSSEMETFKSLVDEHTKLIFLESLSYETHIIPDFQKIIAFAKKRGIPVAVDNTIGIAGNIINPIRLRADFLIEHASNWFGLESDHVGAILIDSGNYAWRDGFIAKFQEANLLNLAIDPVTFSDDNSVTRFSFVDYLKQKRILANNKYSHSKYPLSFENQLEKNIRNKILQQSHHAHNLAKWLKGKTFVNTIDYVGLPANESYFNALKYFSGGFGNHISFSLWTNNRAFDFFLDNLIPKSTQLFKIIGISYERKRVSFNILGEDYEKIVEHFQFAFDRLKAYLGSDYFLYEDLYDFQDLSGY